MVSCESQSRHHNGEPQGAPSRKDGLSSINDDDADEYVHGNYLSLVKVTWHGRLSWEVLWQQPQRAGYPSTTTTAMHTDSHAPPAALSNLGPHSKPPTTPPHPPPTTWYAAPAYHIPPPKPPCPLKHHPLASRQTWTTPCSPLPLHLRPWAPPSTLSSSTPPLSTCHETPPPPSYLDAPTPPRLHSPHPPIRMLLTWQMTQTKVHLLTSRPLTLLQSILYGEHVQVEAFGPFWATNFCFFLPFSLREVRDSEMRPSWSHLREGGGACNREKWVREYPGRGVPGVLVRVSGSSPFRVAPSL